MVDKKATAPERVIQAQIDSTPQDARATGNLKAEQPIREEIPADAELVRGYAKWTDNDGNFRKVPIDGTTAVREPAHEQHELSIEDRDRLYEANALMTPRRDAAKATEIHDVEVHNDEVHASLAGEGVEPAAKKTGPVTDGKEFENATEEVKVGTPASR